MSEFSVGRMEYSYLGRTGLQVSRLVLGTMNFGPDTSEADSHTIMDRALDLGINFFDTANIYGWKLGEGWTEQIVGRWLAKSGRRDEIVLASKVYEPMGEGPNTRGLSARHIRQQVEGSLRRLQTDHLDLYQAHHVDRHTPWDEFWQAMDTLVAQGKVLYVGSSNFAGWHIAQANESARRRSSLGLVSEQHLYNLAERSAELEVLPAARDYGLGFIPWSPLYGGILGGILRKTRRRDSGADLTATRLAANRDRVEAYESFCDEIGHHPATVGLGWLLRQDGVTGPIVGPRTVEHLEHALTALDVDLGRAELARLDEIFPGPGPAPEAYAW
jgi:NDP-hexose 2,3-enoyl reductase